MSTTFISRSFRAMCLAPIFTLALSYALMAPQRVAAQTGVVRRQGGSPNQGRSNPGFGGGGLGRGGNPSLGRGGNSGGIGGGGFSGGPGVGGFGGGSIQKHVTPVTPRGFQPVPRPTQPGFGYRQPAPTRSGSGQVKRGGF